MNAAGGYFADPNIMRAMEAADEGRTDDAIGILDKCLSDLTDSNTRFIAAGMAFEMMIDAGGGDLAVMSGSSPLQREIQHYAKIMAEGYDHVDEPVRSMLIKQGVNMQNIRNLAEGNFGTMKLVLQAKQLSYQGDSRGALVLIDKAIADSSSGHDRLWAAGLATAILADHGPELYGTQDAAESAMLKYGKLTLDFYNAADEVSRLSLERMGVDIRSLRNTISDMQRNRSRRDQFAGEGPSAKQTGCFIATAVYGSSSAPEVMLLRHFRDHFLLGSALGRHVVSVYYAVSPPIADFLSHSILLSSAVRALLLNPLVRVIRTVLNHREKGQDRHGNPDMQH